MWYAILERGVRKHEELRNCSTNTLHNVISQYCLPFIPQCEIVVKAVLFVVHKPKRGGPRHICNIPLSRAHNHKNPKRFPSSMRLFSTCKNSESRVAFMSNQTQNAYPCILQASDEPTCDGRIQSTSWLREKISATRAYKVKVCKSSRNSCTSE